MEILPNAHFNGKGLTGLDLCGNGDEGSVAFLKQGLVRRVLHPVKVSNRPGSILTG